LLSISVTLGALVIIVLVRFFPIQRVSQIVATIAILVLTVAVVAFRMSRPERLFASINTDDVTRVLRSVELPSLDRYPDAGATGFTKGALSTIIYALLIIVFLVFEPRGLAGIWRRIQAYFKTWPFSY